MLLQEEEEERDVSQDKGKMLALTAFIADRRKWLTKATACQSNPLERALSKTFLC